MNEQALVYEVKSSSDSNANKLLSSDDKFFYWNKKKFSNLKIGDYVFVVNTHSGFVLFSQLDKIDLPISYDGSETSFFDFGSEYNVTGDWDEFIRLKIILKLDVHEGWQWKSLGSSETTYLNGDRINTKASENRIKNIKQLNELSSDNLYSEVLNACIQNFGEELRIGRKVWFVAQGKTFTEDRGMKYLWAPKLNKKGRTQFYWDNVIKVKKGDIIFNYSGGLKGVSLAINDAYEAENEFEGDDWEKYGYRVDIKLITLESPISNKIFKDKKREFSKRLTEVKNKPFDVNGGVNQGYLWEFTKEGGRLVKEIYGKSFGNFDIDSFFGDVSTEVKLIKSDNMKNDPIITAIRTKPFILLAGISGTGKSRLVRTLAYKTCEKKELRLDDNKPGNFELITVKPNWHDSSELMGYVSRINGEKYITTSFLKFVAKAWNNLDTPFFLCLDEMNLAPVEQYFAEYLSIVETRQSKSGEITSDFLISKSSFENQKLYSDVVTELSLEDDSRFMDGIGLPSNLVVIGTVNMDETTHSFSRKVLDRAMTFEMNVVDLNAGLDKTKNDWSYPESYIAYDEVVGKYTTGAEVFSLYEESKDVINFLKEINVQLEGSPFRIAYRVRDEFLVYCYYKKITSDGSNWLAEALDEMVFMKVLSRIEGDEMKTGDVLKRLQSILDHNYQKSNSKLKEMGTRLSISGYTSFWE